MAITDSQSRIKVVIRSNGAPLQEYVDKDREEDAPNVVTRYIEAESGADFQIGCTLTTPFPATSVLFSIYLDGTWVSGFFAKQSSYRAPSVDYSLAGTSHCDGKDYFERKFCFSNLKIDDSGVATARKELHHMLKKTGEISVKAFRVKRLRNSQSVLDQTNLAEVGTILEKALKGRALSHSAGLRPPQAVDRVSVMDCDYNDPKERPFLTFNFRYRSRQALKALLIVPRSPSPVPLAERDVDSLTPEEMRDLLKRQRDQQREQAARNVKKEAIKREHGEDGNSARGDNDVFFLSEKRRKLNNTIAEAGIETIDLT